LASGVWDQAVAEKTSISQAAADRRIAAPQDAKSKKHEDLVRIEPIIASLASLGIGQEQFRRKELNPS
jgi:hypothetical protein